MYILSGRLRQVLLYVYEKMYDKGMPQAQTEDQLTAPCRRDIEQTATSQLNLSNHLSLSFLNAMTAKLKRTPKNNTTKQGPTQNTMVATISLNNMGGSREGWTRGPDPLKNHRNIGFLSNTGPNPLKNHKATKLAFNVGPSSARQRNAIEMAFRWRADDGPIIVVFGSTH